MPQLLAINWDDREVRIVLATSGGDSLEIQAVDSIRFDDFTQADASIEVDEGEASPSLSQPKQVGLAIAELIKRHKISRRVATLVCVDRRKVELIHFDLPPAEEKELPELVENLALREAQHLTDEAVLDFFLIEDDPNSPRHVTAAVLPSHELAKINTTLEVAGVKPSRLLLCPYTTASLFTHTIPSPEEPVLVVNQIGNDADLIVMANSQAIFFRSFRVPEGLDNNADEALVKRLVTEVSRTLAVSMPHLETAEPIQTAYLFGNTACETKLAETLQTELDISVQVLDPFGTAVTIKDPPPEKAGKFAPLLGLLLEESASGRHAIDFLHPRKQPPPPNRKRLWTIVASVLGLAILIGGWHVWDQLATVDHTNAVLNKKMQDLKELVKQASKKEKTVNTIQDWQATEVNWLDELRDMSLRLPTSRDAVLLKMTLAPGRSGGGLVSFYGLVRDPSIILGMENNVRDDFHDIRSKRVQEQQTEKDYTWRFETSISVLKRDKAQYAEDLETWTTKIAQQQELEIENQQIENNQPIPTNTEN